MQFRPFVYAALHLCLVTSVHAQVTGYMSPADRRAFDQAALLKSCQQGIAIKRAEYDRLLSERKYWQAAGAIRACADVWPTKELTNLVANAEIQEHQAIIKNPKSTKAERLQAMERLVADYPEYGKQYTAAVGEADRQHNAKVAADLRKQGVRIGMTSDDVLASSWGRPQSINRTTNAYGTHEQWVYGRGSYLYFDNGKLTSIQN
jgi:hypothetical protein